MSDLDPVGEHLPQWSNILSYFQTKKLNLYERGTEICV